MIKNSIIALLFGSVLFACVGDIGTTLKIDEVNRLLSGDSAKFWLRTDRLENGESITVDNSCENSNLLLFVMYESVADTAFLFSNYSPELCSETTSPLLITKAVYEVSGAINEDFEDLIEITEASPEPLGNLEVLDLTSDFLRIRYSEDEKEIVETYDGSASFQDEKISEFTFREP